MSDEERDKRVAALGYAARGWPVLPLHTATGTGGCSCGDPDCGSIGKHPRTAHGLKDATTDPATIAKWWGLWPVANVGIRTGTPSGFFVLDIDGEEAARTLRESGRTVPKDALWQKTGRGWQVLFEMPADFVVKGDNTGAVAVHVDVKGEGGYIVAPPSTHANGNSYSWLTNVEPRPAPAWLLEALRPVERERSKPTDATAAASGLHPYVAAALEDEAAKVRAARVGTRDHYLNVAAFSLGQLEAAGLSETDARAGLLSAAMAAGLGEAESLRTFASGWEAGKKCPRDIPDRMRDYSPRPLAADAEHRPSDGLQGMIEESINDIGTLLSSVKPESVEWLWEGRIPSGKLTVLDGDPGLGKSTVTVDIVARVSTGQVMPDGTGGGEPAGVVILSAEDGLADTIVPRLMAANADLRRVLALESCPDSQGEGTHPPMVPDDLPHVRAAIQRVSAKLVVIDPLMAYLSGDTNSHRDQDIRRVLFRIATLAEETGVAVLVVRHLNKSNGGPALYRGGGSIGIIGAARSGLLIACDPDDENRRVLASTKSNLGAPPVSLSFRLEADESGPAHVVWGGVCNHNANRLLEAPATDEERTAVDDAKDFLQAVLADGPKPSGEVYSEANGAGISKRTLERAKNALGVESSKQGLGGGWAWKFPEDRQGSPNIANPTGWRPSESAGGLREPARLIPRDNQSVGS